MATFIRIRDNDLEIRYVNRDLIDTFAYDRVNETTKIGFVGDLYAYLEIDGDITDVILDPKKQEIDDWFMKRVKERP